ncbi:MAG: ABC transporter permease [Thermomicrobiales bacterium]
MVATTAAARRGSGEAARTRLTAGLTVGVPLLVILCFVVLPLILVLVYSFYSLNPDTGLMQRDFSWENYERVLTNDIYLRVFWRTAQIALLATGIALLLAYPIGYTIGAVAPREQQGILLLLIIVPFWTSYIVRTYGWIGILQNDGFFDSLFGWIPGLPTEVLYSRAAVIVGFVHVFLPLMILPIYASARNLDRRLLEAASDLGCTPARAFLRVTLPLTMPGVVAGVILFFIPTFGSFVTPQLLGGLGDLMMGNVIATQFGEAFNWPLGSALSIVMTLVVIAALAIFFRFADMESIYG